MYFITRILSIACLIQRIMIKRYDRSILKNAITYVLFNIFNFFFFNKNKIIVIHVQYFQVFILFLDIKFYSIVNKNQESRFEKFIFRKLLVLTYFI